MYASEVDQTRYAHQHIICPSALHGGPEAPRTGHHTATFRYLQVSGKLAKGVRGKWGNLT